MQLKRRNKVSNGKDKKKFTDTHPKGAYRMTRSTGLKTIKPKKKKEEYDVEWVKEAGSYDKYLIPKEFRNLYPNKKKKATVAAKRRELRKKLYKKILKKKAPKAVDIAKRKKPRSMKKGGTVKETGIYKLHKGEKVVPVKKKKKTEPKIRPKKSTLTKETTLIGKAKPKEEKSGFWHPKGHIERGSGPWGYLKKGRKEYRLKKRKKTAKKKKTTKTLARRPALPH